MVQILLIASGGALGAVARWSMIIALSSYFKQAHPVGTLSVNVLGSFIMGMLAVYFLRMETLSEELKLFLTIGFLGSFTTFSTFSMDALSFYMRGEVTSAAAYIMASVCLSLGAVLCGTLLMERFYA